MTEKNRNRVPSSIGVLNHNCWRKQLTKIIGRIMPWMDILIITKVVLKSTKNDPFDSKEKEVSKYLNTCLSFNRTIVLSAPISFSC